MSVVGFDFGHQSCFIAVARQGGIETITNDYSDRNTPAFVSMGDRHRVMGAAAKQKLNMNFKNTVWGWKKLIGRQFNDPQVQQEKGELPYNVIEGPDGTTAIQVQYLCEQQTFTPEQITSMLLTKLKEVASFALKTKVVDCVISVPCYWTDAERRAMMDAAQTAGLNCLRLMNDTTATALAYGIYKQDLPAPEEKPRHVVFVDMGHADLQLSACAFNKGKLKVLATSSDANLGGRDLDRLLARHFCEDFKKRYKLDVLSKPRAWLRLMQECEKLKKNMSANVTEIPINVECIMEDTDVTGHMKREDMEEMASELLQRMEQTMQAVLDNAELKPDDIYSVEIVGGSTRIPAVKELVQKVFDKVPSTTLNADEVVARGCALQGAILSPTFRVRDFSITDAQPYSITLSWQGGMEEADQENCLEAFNRFHQFPFSKMLTFYRREPFTVDAKYTYEHDIPYPTPAIGSFTIDKILPQPNGESSKVKVKVRVNIHGIFVVTSASMVEKVEEEEVKEEPMDVENGPVEEKKEGEGGEEKAEKKDESMDTEQNSEQQQQSQGQADQKEANGENATENTMQTEEAASEQQADPPTENETKEEKEEGKKESAKKKKVKLTDLPILARVPQLSKQDLNLMIEKESQMIMQDKLEKERRDSKNAVEEYVYDMRDKVNGPLEKFIKKIHKEQFVRELEETENWLYEEGEDQHKHVYVDKLKALKDVGDPVVKRSIEFYERPAAFNEFGHALQQVRKALEAYEKKDEKYAHLEESEMEKVRKCVKEKMAWFEKNMNATAPLQQRPFDDPVVLADQIRTEKQFLDSTCNAILNKPKPKPKEEPPKEEKKQKDAKNGKQGEGDSSTTEGEGQEQSQEQTPTENKEDMDLD